MKVSETRKAIVIALAGVVGLLAGGATGGLFASELAPLPILVGFAVFLLCGKRALRVLHVDEMVFVHGRMSDAGRFDAVPILTAGASLGHWMAGQGANPDSPSAEPSPRSKASRRPTVSAFRGSLGRDDPFGRGSETF